MNDLTIKLVWEKMTPKIEEMNGLPIPSNLQIALQDLPPFYDAIILQGYERERKFCIEHAYILGCVGRYELSSAEVNELLYEAGYPEVIENHI